MAHDSEITPDTEKLFAEETLAHLDSALSSLRAAMVTYGKAFPKTKRSPDAPRSLLIHEAKRAVKRAQSATQHLRDTL